MRCPHCGNRISDGDAESTRTCPVCKRSLDDAPAADGPEADATTSTIPILERAHRSVTAKFDIDRGAKAVPRDKAKTPVNKPPPPPPKQETAKKQETKKLGPFEVRGLLGEGGMGAVYDGYDPQLDRRVAIKVLSPKLAQDAQFVQRFLTEARAVARVSHPNVCSVFSAGSDGDQHYFVMEFIDGESLDDKVEKNGRLTPKGAIGYAMQAVRGLAAAYERGIVHRDVKPANLMLNKEDEMKVTDFGLAKLSGQDLKLTQAGSVMGSPHFMAPEQGRGEESDVHADIYSLGATLYYLLTGRPPYEGDTALAVILKHQEAPVPQIERAPPSVNRLLGKMLAKNPTERYPGYGEVLKDLIRLDRSGLLQDKLLQAAGPGGARAQAPTPAPGRQAVPRAGSPGVRPSDIMTERVDDEAVLLSQLDSAMKKSPSVDAQAAPPRKSPGSALASRLLDKARKVASPAPEAGEALEEGELPAVPLTRYLLLGGGLLLLVMVVALKPWNWFGGDDGPGNGDDKDKYTRLIGDPSARVRRVAVRTLEKHNRPWAENLLMRTINDESPLVREETLKVLTNWKKTQFAPRISRILVRDGSGDVRRAAAVSLQKLTGYVFPPSIDWRSDSEDLRKIEAERFTKWWRSEQEPP